MIKEEPNIIKKGNKKQSNVVNKEIENVPIVIKIPVKNYQLLKALEKYVLFKYVNITKVVL